MINAIIIDDEPPAADVIKMLVNSYTDEINIRSICHNVKDAVKDILRISPELIFLDVELADGSGFEVLEHIPQMQVKIIFVTAYDHYALKAIKHNAFDYILKPIVPEELFQALKKVIHDHKNAKQLPDNLSLLNYLQGRRSNKIAVPDRHGLHYYSMDEIIFIEADGSYCKMHLEIKKTVLVTRKLKDFEESLGDKGFLRVHKSFLINIDHITELHRDGNGYLVMTSGERIPLGAKDKEQIIQKIKFFSNIV